VKIDKHMPKPRPKMKGWLRKGWVGFLVRVRKGLVGKGWAGLRLETLMML
jgi:hypothetical protein